MSLEETGTVLTIAGMRLKEVQVQDRPAFPKYFSPELVGTGIPRMRSPRRRLRFNTVCNAEEVSTLYSLVGEAAQVRVESSASVTTNGRVFVKSVRAEGPGSIVTIDFETDPERPLMVSVSDGDGSVWGADSWTDHEKADPASLSLEDNVQEAIEREWDETVDGVTTYHPPTKKAIGLHERIRQATAALLMTQLRYLPECPEKDRALERTEEAMFWSNAAIARRVSAKEAK